jgi:hypothetical protein
VHMGVAAARREPESHPQRFPGFGQTLAVFTPSQRNLLTVTFDGEAILEAESAYHFVADGPGVPK